MSAQLVVWMKKIRRLQDFRPEKSLGDRLTTKHK